MSEQHPKDYEQLITPEQDHDRQEALSSHHEQLETARNAYADKIETIRGAIEHEAVSHEHEINKIEHEQHDEHRPHHYLTKKIKNQQYQKTVAEIQKSLSPSQQRFSKLVHQPAIEKVSEVGAKTIARPSGILGGALFALIGSSIVMYIARHIGFEVPNTIFILLFITGFAVGLLLELLLHTLHRTKTRKHSPKQY